MPPRDTCSHPASRILNPTFLLRVQKNGTERSKVVCLDVLRLEQLNQIVRRQFVHRFGQLMQTIPRDFLPLIVG